MYPGVSLRSFIQWWCEECARVCVTRKQMIRDHFKCTTVLFYRQRYFVTFALTHHSEAFFLTACVCCWPSSACTRKVSLPPAAIWIYFGVTVNSWCSGSRREDIKHHSFYTDHIHQVYWYISSHRVLTCNFYAHVFLNDDVFFSWIKKNHFAIK